MELSIGLEKMGNREREDRRSEQGTLLLQLVEQFLPYEFQNGTRDPWYLIGPAMIARQAGTLESVLALRHMNRTADAEVLVRCMYEHATFFAWLAADPPDRLLRFRKSDSTARLKTDAAAISIGLEMLESQNRAALEDLVENAPKSAPDLRAAAKEADQYWTARVPWMSDRGPGTTFLGMYEVIYRGFSAVAHPTLVGLGCVVRHPRESIAVVEMESRRADRHGPLGLAVMLFGLSLYLASEAIGWPNREDVLSVFEGEPEPGSFPS